MIVPIYEMKLVKDRKQFDMLEVKTIPYSTLPFSNSSYRKSPFFGLVVKFIVQQTAEDPHLHCLNEVYNILKHQNCLEKNKKSLFESAQNT